MKKLIMIAVVMTFTSISFAATVVGKASGKGECKDSNQTFGLKNAKGEFSSSSGQTRGQGKSTSSNK